MLTFFRGKPHTPLFLFLSFPLSLSLHLVWRNKKGNVDCFDAASFWVVFPLEAWVCIPPILTADGAATDQRQPPCPPSWSCKLLSTSQIQIHTHCHAIYSSHHLSMQHFNLVSFSSCRDTCPPHSLLVVCSSLLISLYCSSCHSLSSFHFPPFFPFSSNGFNAPVVRLHHAFTRWIAPERCCCSTCTVLLSSCPPHQHCLMHPHCQSVSNH